MTELQFVQLFIDTIHTAENKPISPRVHTSRKGYTASPHRKEEKTADFSRCVCEN